MCKERSTSHSKFQRKRKCLAIPGNFVGLQWYGYSIRAILTHSVDNSKSTSCCNLITCRGITEAMHNHITDSGSGMQVSAPSFCAKSSKDPLKTNLWPAMLKRPRHLWTGMRSRAVTLQATFRATVKQSVSRSLLKVVNQSCQLSLSFERATNHLIQPSGDARSISAASLAQKVLW